MTFNAMNFNNTGRIFRSDSVCSGDTSGKRINLDSNALAFFQRDLEQIDPKIYKTLEASLSFLSTFFTDTTIDAGINRLGYRMYDGFGQSKAGAKNASDTPLVNVSGKEFTSYFTNIDVALEYTAQDILAMRFANNNLVSRLRDRAMRSNFEFMNLLAFFGNEELKIDGLLTHQHINNKEAVVKGKSGKIEWKEKTANEIVEDVMAAYNNALDATNNMIVPDTLLISLKALNLLKSKIFNSFDSCTVFRHLENTLNCTIKGLHELNDAFTGGTNGFVFFNNDREYVEQLMPVSFEATEPQQNAWTYTVYCRSRYGGLVIRQPKMFVMRHGI